MLDVLGDAQLHSLWFKCNLCTFSCQDIGYIATLLSNAFPTVSVAALLLFILLVFLNSQLIFAADRIPKQESFQCI